MLQQSVQPTVSKEKEAHADVLEPPNEVNPSFDDSAGELNKVNTSTLEHH